MNRPSAQPKIGIVSGIGPLAGADVLEKVFRHAALAHGAVEDAEYPDVVLVNHGIAGVDNIGTLNDEFEQSILSMVGQLEENGATIIGIACNTAHIYLHKIAVGKSTTVVNLIDQVALEAASTKRNYLLLTSATTKQQRLYHNYLEKHDVQFSETSLEHQKMLDEAIGLVMAYRLQEAGVLLESVLQDAENQGFEAVIAGCTELPIAIDNVRNQHGLHVVDSNYVLAQSLVEAYYSGIAKAAQ